MQFLLKIIPFIQELSPVEVFLVMVMLFQGIITGVQKVPAFLRKKKVKREINTISDIHISCPNYNSILLIVEKAMAKSDEITRIKYTDTVYEQMNEVEISWTVIKEMFEDKFDSIVLDYLQQESLEANEEDIRLAKKNYNLILSGLEQDIFGLMRRWIRKNHFLEKTDIEFQFYIEEKLKALTHRVTKSIDYEYESAILIVSRKFLHERNLEILPEISKIVIPLFLKIKMIALDKSISIEKIKKEISSI